MVKTRGLGRVLGRVVGKGLGRGDGDDSDGAPQCQRPTASARWRRVPITVADDVPIVPADSPVVPVATCPSRASEGEAHGCAFQRRKGARSRHQRLFVENVGKTEGNRSK